MVVEGLNPAEGPEEGQLEATEGGEQPEGESQETESGAGGEGFFDPKNVPPELQQAYKQMQSAFTKKTQTLAEERKQIEQLRHRSNLLEQLVNHPEFQEYVRQRESGGQTTEEEEVPPEIERALQKYLGPVQQQLQNLEVQREREQFVAAYPDWNQHEDGMKEAWNSNPSLTMEQAYLIAVAKAGKQKQQRTNARQRAISERPGSSVSATRAPKAAESFNEALTAAAEEVGIDLNLLRPPPRR